MRPEQPEPDAVRSAFARRGEAFERFAAWEVGHVNAPSPADAFSAAGWLYDVLPPASRQRPIQTTGVQLLHRALARLTVGL